MSYGDYTDKYSQDFADELKEIVRSNPKVKGMVEKAIPVILANPFKDSAEFEIGRIVCRRKHIAADQYRIIYEVDQVEQFVKFFNIWLKNKATYKHSPSIF